MNRITSDIQFVKSDQMQGALLKIFFSMEHTPSSIFRMKILHGVLIEKAIKISK
ncbi:hypothetical protein GW17_00047434 [Ensete ventricosum]|nr:hypothetical protein GW17_00047434 [Ensete ventricosum]RZS22455.1 hypothetical protein BHM03_00055254 [Ensete ventricosum]